MEANLSPRRAGNSLQGNANQKATVVMATAFRRACIKMIRFMQQILDDANVR